MDACHAPPPIAAAYVALGAASADNFALVARLRTEPQASACLLAGGLHVVRGDAHGRAVNDKARRVVWRVRALRAIAGRDFATPAYPHEPCRSDDQCRFARRGHEWAFFGTWMSRDVAYLAPVQAQRRIIASWRGWARSRPLSAGLGRDEPDAWYF